MKIKQNIEFSEEFRFSYNFGRSQIIKIIVVTKHNMNINEYYFNMGSMVSEQFHEFSLPFQYEQNSSINVTKEYLKLNTNSFINTNSNSDNNVTTTNNVMDKGQQIEMVFKRNMDEEPELAFFLEFNFVSMQYLANKLFYKISYLKETKKNKEIKLENGGKQSNQGSPTLKHYKENENNKSNYENSKNNCENNYESTQEKIEIFSSNERYGKNPIYFDPAYILKSFLKSNITLVFDFTDKNGYIGEVILTKLELSSIERKSYTTHIIDKNGCIVCKVKISCKKIPSRYFLDYLNHGLDINFAIGIDYTSSNLDPSKPNSLHTLKGDGKNQYENAIRSFGNILSHYDKSNSVPSIPVFGFGGIPKGKNLISHCFNINGMTNPNIDGIENVIKIYKESLKKVKLLGPTKINLLIKAVLSDIIKVRKQKEDEVKVKYSHNYHNSNNSNSPNNKNNLNSNVVPKTNQIKSQFEAPKIIIKPKPNFIYPKNGVLLFSSPFKKMNNNANYININDSPYKHFKLSPKRTESSNYYEELKTAENIQFGNYPYPMNSPLKTPNKKNKLNTEMNINNNNNNDYDNSLKNFTIPLSERKYNLLLLLTDGKIDDMIETKSILVEASNYPISVIIVGIGNANFGNMAELSK